MEMDQEGRADLSQADSNDLAHLKLNPIRETPTHHHHHHLIPPELITRFHPPEDRAGIGEVFQAKRIINKTHPFNKSQFTSGRLTFFMVTRPIVNHFTNSKLKACFKVIVE
jgi:hypothetical protein